MKRFLDERVAGLFPGYFALCMATGIVSIACSLLGMPRLARALLFINVPAYAVLVVLTLAGFLYRVVRPATEVAIRTSRPPP